MKSALKGLVLSAIGMLLSTQALANGLQLGVPGYGGSGCPQGTASAVLSPDNKQLSILFDAYMAEAGNTTGKKVDYKNCNITIPVQVPQGWAISVFKVDYRGFNFLPAGARSIFSVEYFFAGMRGPRLDKVFTGSLNDSYLITDNLVASTMVWSACGAQTNLRINSSMRAISNSRMDQALATVDSADISSGLIYHLAWRRCP